MSLKSKLLAGTAALTMVSGVGMVLVAGTAMAGTPSCGKSCINLFQTRYGGVVADNGVDGKAQFNPSFVTDVYKQGQHVGQPIIEFRASNSDPAEDWTVSNEGQVSEFLAAGLVSPALALHYGCEPTSAGGAFPECPYSLTFTPPATTADPSPKPVTVTPDLFAFEWEYAPFGADSGLCMGVAATAISGEQVTLQPCGVSSKTIWVVDFVQVLDAKNGWEQVSPDPRGPYGFPIINGSDTNFSHPFVLTYNGEPTAFPRASAFVANLTGFSNESPDSIFVSVTGGTPDSSLATVSDQQQWQFDTGILP